MLFELKFYKGFMMKVLSAECLVFLKIQKVSRNYIKIALLFYDNQVDQNSHRFSKFIKRINELLQSIKGNQSFEIFDGKIQKFLTVKQSEVRGGLFFYSYHVKSYYDPFFNPNISKEYGEFLTKRLDSVNYFSQTILSRIIQYISRDRFIHLASYSSFDRTPCLKFIKEKSVLINGEDYIYYILLEFNFLGDVLALIRGVLLIDNPFIIDDVFKTDREYSSIKRQFDEIIGVHQNHIQLYRFTIQNTIKYLKQLDDKDLKVPISFAVQQNVLLENLKRLERRHDPYFYTKKDSEHAIDPEKVKVVSPTQLLDMFQSIADEWGWKNQQRIEKKKVWDSSSLQDCYKYREIALKTLDESDRNELLYEAYNNMIEDLSDFNFTVESTKSDSSIPVIQVQEKTAGESFNQTRKLYTKVLQKGLTVLLELNAQELQGNSGKEQFILTVYVLCFRCVSSQKNIQKECKYVNWCDNWIASLISQIRKNLDRCYLMHSAQNLRNNRTFSLAEITEIQEMCHCQVYDVNMKSVLNLIRRKMTADLSNGNSPFAKDQILYTKFAELFKICLNTFFIETNFEEKPLYLYKLGDSQNEISTHQSLKKFSQLKNQYLKKVLTDYVMNTNSTGKKDNYLLLVEVSIKNNKNKKKQFFKGAEDFFDILIDQVSQASSQVKELNMWLRFKNYYPKGKEKKSTDLYSTYGKNSLQQVVEFMDNSKRMFQNIVKHITENIVVDAIQSLASTFCMELIMSMPESINQTIRQLLMGDLKKCHSEKTFFMELYDNKKFDSVKFLKETVVKNPDFQIFKDPKGGNFIYRLIFPINQKEILGIIVVHIIDKSSYKFRHYFQMNLGASDVNLYLEMVQNEMIQIVEKANVDMIMQAVRLNLELPADVRLKSLVDQELDQLPVLSRKTSLAQQDSQLAMQAVAHLKSSKIHSLQILQQKEMTYLDIVSNTSAFSKIYDIILNSPDLSFAKVRALDENSAQMKNLFIFENAKREVFIVLVDSEDLGHNFMNHSFGKESNNSLLNSFKDTPGQGIGLSFEKQVTKAPNLTVQDSLDKTKKTILKCWINKFRITFSFFGSVVDQEFFEFIYKFFEQKVNNLLIQKCGVVLQRNQDIQLDSVLGYYLFESDKRCRFEFRLFEEQDQGILDMCSFSLLIKQNFLKMQMNAVKGENSQFASRVSKMEHRKYFGKTTQIELQTDNSDHLFFFNFNEKGQLAYGKALFFLQILDPIYSLNFNQNFMSGDQFYLTLDGETQKLSSTTTSAGFRSRKESWNSQGILGSSPPRSRLSSIHEAKDYHGPQFDDRDLETTETAGTREHEILYQSPLFYKKNTFTLNQNCLQNINFIQEVEVAAEDQDECPYGHIRFEVMYRGDLKFDELKAYLLNTLKHSYIEYCLEQQLHLMHVRNNSCFKSKTDFRDMMKCLEQIHNLESLPISVDKLEIDFKFGESMIKKTSKYSVVKQFKEIDKRLFFEFVSLMHQITSENIQKSAKDLGFKLVFLLNGEEHIFGDQGESDADSIQKVKDLCSKLSKENNYESNLLIFPKAEKKEAALRMFQRFMPERRKIQGGEKPISESNDASQNSSTSASQSILIPSRRSFVWLKISSKGLQLMTYNVKSGITGGLFQSLRNQTIYTHLRTQMINHIANPSNSYVDFLTHFDKECILEVKQVNGIVRAPLIKKKEEYFQQKKEDLNLMQDEGGLTKLIEEVVDYPAFSEDQRTIQFDPSDRKTLLIVKSGLNNLAEFIRKNLSRFCKKDDQDLVKMAQSHLKLSKEIFMEHLDDVRIMTLLNNKIQDKVQLFDIAKPSCSLIESFTIPMYYFSRDFIELQKMAPDDQEQLELSNRISKEFRAYFSGFESISFESDDFRFEVLDRFYNPQFSSFLFLGLKEVESNPLYLEYFSKLMQSYILKTDQIRVLFYVSGSLVSTKLGELLFVDLKIQDMICNVEMYQYVTTKFRESSQGTPNDKFKSQISMVKSLIQEQLISTQKKALAGMSKSFSPSLQSNFEQGVVCSNLSNQIRKRRINIPNISRIFKLRIPASLFFDNVYEKEAIESYFFDNSANTDRFVVINENYIIQQIQKNASQQSDRTASNDITRKTFEIIQRVASHIENQYFGSSPQKPKRMQESSKKQTADAVKQEGKDLEKKLEIRFSLIRNEELDHLQYLRKTTCYFFIENGQLIIKERTNSDGEIDEEDYYQFNVMYSYTNEKVTKLNRTIVSEIHRIIQSRLLEYFDKEHLPELIFKRILHLKYPTSPSLATVLENLIVNWDKFSVNQPSLYSEVSSTTLGLELSESSNSLDLKVLVGAFNDFRILQKDPGSKLVIFQDISKHMVVLQIDNDKIKEIFSTVSGKGGAGKKSDLSNLWLRLIAWFMSMSLKV